MCTVFGGNRKQYYLSLPQDEHHRLLVPRTATNHWSNSTGTYSKDNVPLLVTGKKDDKWEKDRVKMERHLKFSSLDQAMFPEKDQFKRMFNPLDVPILDILAVSHHCYPLKWGSPPWGRVWPR